MIVKVDDRNQRDEAHCEDMSSLQVGVHHNIDCQSIPVAGVEDLEVLILNLPQGSIPPPGLKAENNSDAQPAMPTAQFNLGTPTTKTINGYSSDETIRERYVGGIIGKRWISIPPVAKSEGSHQHRI